MFDPATIQTDVRQLRSGLRALLRRFSVSERADVACCGMTVAQAATLEVLAAEGPMRLGALGQRLGIAPSTLTRNLDRLRDGGLLRRDPDDRDGRAVRVALTASGSAAAARVEAMDQEFARQVLERLPPARRRRALEGLRDLLGAVREATEDCCPGAYDHLMRDEPRVDGRCHDGGPNEPAG
ncbi:MAG: MarR family winged helix-turn-helix transcriptional regulator [Acidobacteriota bacterium]|jgi:DNA-binding MarR family transcriptional regulator